MSRPRRPPPGDEDRTRRAYRALLRLYPRAFRDEFGDELLAFVGERAREARRRGVAGRVRLWAELLADAARSLPAAHLRAHRTRRRGDGSMTTLVRDLRYAARSFRRRPGFTLAALATLATGIGAATTMYSVLDRVVLRPLPYDQAHRLVQVGTRYPDWGGLGSVTPPELFRWQERSRSFEALAGSRLQSLTYDAGDGPVVVSGVGVSGSFFDALGVDAFRGRVFGPDEDRAGAPPVAVLTHGAWSRRWGADPAVVGRTLELDEKRMTVVGVLPRDYVPPEALYHGDVEVYFPLHHVSDPLDDPTSAFLQVVGLLRPGATLDRARAEMSDLAPRILADLGIGGVERSVGIEPLYERTVGSFGDTLVPFLGAVAILLLVACANVANLFLVRAGERRREMALRTSLGAGRRRIVRQLLTESLLLSLAAGAAGALLAYGGTAAFRLLSPESVPRAAEVGVDLPILGFALTLAVLTGVVFGLVPALQALRGDQGETLRAGGSGSGRGASRRDVRVRSALVVAELAVALVLFAGAALLGRSFVELVNVDPGFRVDGVAFVYVDATSERYEDPEVRSALYRELVRSVEALPGVVAAGATNNLPFTRNQSVRNITIEGWDADGEDGPDVSYHRVFPGYFETLGIEVLAGRAFTPADDGAGTVPVVVNRTMAETFWPDRTAVGARLHMGTAGSDRPWMEVVGVVDDVKQMGLAGSAEPELYLPYLAVLAGPQTVVARTDGDAAAMARTLRETVWAVAPDIPVRRAGTMETLRSESVVTPRFYSLLLGAFALVALVLTAVGVYGTTTYAVRQRNHEMGVRMALGADAGSLVGLVLRRGVVLTGAGLLLGLVGAVLATDLLEGLVFGVEPGDPATLAGAGLALGAVSLLAAWLPARRAARVDPVATLRAD